MEKAEEKGAAGEVTFVSDCCCLNVSFGEVTGERWKDWKDMNGDEKRVSSFSITSHCAMCVCASAFLLAVETGASIVNRSTMCIETMGATQTQK